MGSSKPSTKSRRGNSSPDVASTFVYSLSTFVTLLVRRGKNPIVSLGPRATHVVGGEQTPSPPLGHSNTADRRASSRQLPNLHHCRAAPNGPQRLTLRSGPILHAGGYATRPIKATAPVRPHFDGGQPQRAATSEFSPPPRTCKNPPIRLPNRDDRREAVSHPLRCCAVGWL